MKLDVRGKKVYGTVPYASEIFGIFFNNTKFKDRDIENLNSGLPMPIFPFQISLEHLQKLIICKVQRGS